MLTSERTRPARGEWTATRDGAHLRGRLSSNTSPELALRRAVHRLGLRFRLHTPVAGCRPDFVLPGSQVAVFVDGCFWHSCPLHGATAFKGPKRRSGWQASRASTSLRSLQLSLSRDAIEYVLDLLDAVLLKLLHALTTNALQQPPSAFVRDLRHGDEDVRVVEIEEPFA